MIINSVELSLRGSEWNTSPEVDPNALPNTETGTSDVTEIPKTKTYEK